MFISILSLFPLFIPLQTQNSEPVSLEVVFDGVPEFGSGWTLTITLKALEDLKEAEIWVEKTDGLKVKSGSLFWHGVLKSGGSEVIEILMTLKGAPPQEVTVNLVGHTAGGRRFEKKIYRPIAFISERL